MDDKWVAKLVRKGKPNTSDFPNVDARVGHQRHRRRGTLDKIQSIMLEEEEEKEEEDIHV